MRKRQTKNAAQQATVDRLKAKGWREDPYLVALAVTMLFDRPYVGLPNPHVIHVRRDGKCYRGNPSHSTVPQRNRNWQYSE